MAWSWRVLRSGGMRLDGGSMFGVVPRALWARMTPPDDANRIALAANCLLLEGGGTRVLVEAGFGDKWSDKERDLYALERRTIVTALAEVGVAPADIDLVVVTHLHFDHAGGLTHLDGAGHPVPTFPRARVAVQRLEWEDALANKSTMSRTYLRDHLDPIADRVALHDGEIQVLPGLWAWPTPGHTWGHQSVRFEAEGGVVCYSGDVVPTVNHVAPAFSMGYDMLPYDNSRTKAALLDRARAESWRIALDHEPGPCVVTVEADGDRKGRYRLVPVA